MYERPRLNRVGDAENVVLGIISFGDDLDMTWITGQDEFASDSQSE